MLFEDIFPLRTPYAASESMASPAWIGTSIALSQDEVKQHALDAIHANMQAFESKAFTNTYWIATFLAQMVLFDQLTNLSGNFSDKVFDYLNTFEQTTPGFALENVAHTIDFGYAAIRAHSVYGEERFLPIATQAWEYGNSWTISTADVTAGKLAGKNFTLPKCNYPLQGATFFTTDAQDPGLNESACGIHLLLSALLANATQDQNYLNAAMLSFDFSYAYLYTGDSVVNDNILATTCKLGGAPSPSDAAVDTGRFLESISVLGAQTQNSTILTLIPNMVEIILAHTVWQDTQGVLNQDFQSFIMRALSAVIVNQLDDLQPQLRETLEAFVAVQFNSVIESPPIASLPATNVSANLDVMLSAVRLANNTTPSSPSSSSIPPTSSTSTSKTALAAGIAGGVLGLLILIIASYFFYRRVRKRRVSELELPETVIEPLSLPPPEPRIHPHPFVPMASKGQNRAWTNRIVATRPDTPAETATEKNGPLGVHSSIPITSSSGSREDDTRNSDTAGLEENAGVSDIVERGENRENVLTGELVRILVNRLRRGDIEWTEREALPRYEQ